MTNPEELQNRFSGLSRSARISLAIALLLALGAGAFWARPAWRALKHARATTFADASHQALAQGNLDLALDHARAALQLEPLNPDLLRLNARLLTDLGAEASLRFWQALVQRPNPDPEDPFCFVEAALAFQRPELVGDTVSNLLASGPGSARLHRLGALYHLGIGDSNAALAQARSAHQLEPTNPTNALLVASLLAPSADAPGAPEARTFLREVARTSGPLRWIALRRLVQTDLGQRADREWIEQLLSGTPQRSAAEEVLLAETRVRLDPTTTRQTFEALIESIPHQDTERLTLVVDALLRLQLHPEVLRLTPEGRSLLNRTLFLGRFQALLALDRAEEAYRHLLTAGAPVPPYELALAKVEASIQCRNSTRRDAHLEELLHAALDHPTRLRTVAELAERQGSFEVAGKAWRQLGLQPGQALVSLRALQRIADRRGDTWTARDHARKALRAGSPRPSLPLEIAYYDLLLGENLDQALTQALAYVAGHPRDFFARATVALAHLRRAEPTQARAALERFVVENPQPRPEILAILAATCGQNGLTLRAREIAARVPLDRLRPEERDLVAPWLPPLSP